MRCLWVFCLWALVSTGSASPRARIPRQVNDDEINPAQLDLLPAASEAPLPATDNSAVQDKSCDCEDDLCVCVPYYLCETNRSIIEDGLGIFDLRMPRNLDDACDYLEVCCSSREVLLTPITVPPPTSVSLVIVTEQSNTPSINDEQTTSPTEQSNTPSINDKQTTSPTEQSNTPSINDEQTTSTTEQSNTPSTNDEQTTSSTEQSLTPSKPTIPITDEVCGIRNEIGVSSLRITGALNGEAQFGEFPWMMAVMKQDVVNGQDTLTYQCGGSLITPRVVLTAAHCVQGKTGLMVRAGEWDTQRANEPLPTQDRHVHDIVIHEQYYKGGLHNDVALLFLDSAFHTQVENVGTICLPDQDENMDNRQCVATGWGKDLFGQEGQYQVILKKIDLPTVPRDQCQQDLRETRLGSRFNLHSSFLCAGGEVGKDTCKGDGGGPLVCPSSTNPQVYIQAGIVAWGIGCATKTPGVYVDVAKFRNWIDSHVATFKFDEGVKLGPLESESSGLTPFQGEGKPIHFDSTFGGENNETSIIMNS